jgi:antitoxin YefM
VAISLTAFRQNIYQHVKQVLADDSGSLIINTKDGDVELVNSAELRSLREFNHLFSSPANASRLLASIERAKNGETLEVTLEDIDKLMTKNNEAVV